MPKSVNELMPNVGKDTEVILFYGFECVEHYPFRNSSLIGKYLCDILLDLDTNFPEGCYYMMLHYHDHTTTVKQYGNHITIINSKILFPQNEQTAPHGS